MSEMPGMEMAKPAPPQANVWTLFPSIMAKAPLSLLVQCWVTTEVQISQALSAVHGEHLFQSHQFGRVIDTLPKFLKKTNKKAQTLNNPRVWYFV